MTRRLLLATLCLLCVAMLTAASSGGSAGATGATVKRTRVTLTLPKRGHALFTQTSTRVPRRLKGYYAYVQFVAPNGSRSPKAAIGQPLVFRSAAGKKLFSLTLSTAYSGKTGRMRVGLKLRNIGVRAKGSRVTALVTIGWKR